MKAILRRRTAPPEILTEEQATKIAEAQAARAALIEIRLPDKRIIRFPWSDITGLDTIHPTTCVTCGADVYNEEPHYCQHYSAISDDGKPLDFDSTEIPKYSRTTIAAIESRPNPPQGDANFIAHLERITGQKAEPGKKYELKGKHRLALHRQRQLMKSGTPGSEAHSQAFNFQ